MHRIEVGQVRVRVRVQPVYRLLAQLRHCGRLHIGGIVVDERVLLSQALCDHRVVAGCSRRRCARSDCAASRAARELLRRHLINLSASSLLQYLL